jgi:hypothetical protein
MGSNKNSRSATTKTAAYRFCGYAGFGLACALGYALVIQRALSLSLILIITPLTVLIFLALVLVTKILVGYELIIYYHHEIAVVTGTALFLQFLHQPVFPYLDATVLGLGIFLACGRIGCLLVGCCHGRPFRWGICYGEEHAAAGFTWHYVGVPLFPVQALESSWALMIVLVGTLMVLRGSPPGSALTWYIIVYGWGRFNFEFLRGDPDRPYFCGFSEAQWTSLILMSLTVASEVRGILPLRSWHIASVALIVLTMAAVTLHRHFRRIPTHRLLHPRHIQEIADAIELAVPRRVATPEPDPWIRVGRTSLGIQISGCDVQLHGGVIPHYALSQSGRPLTADVARVLGVVICRLKHSGCDFDLIPGSQAVFQFLVRPERAKPQKSKPTVGP